VKRSELLLHMQGVGCCKAASWLQALTGQHKL